MKRFLLYSVLFIVGLLSNISLSAQQSDTSQAQLKVVNANIQCPFEGNSQIYFLSLQHRKARIYRSTRYKGDIAYEYNYPFKDKLIGIAGLTTSHGVIINDRSFIGAGIGLLFSAPDGIIDQDRAMMPIFVTAKRYFPIGKRYNSLFVSLDAGTYVGPKDTYVFPRVGFSFACKKWRSVDLSVGYQKLFPLFDFGEDSGYAGIKLSYCW